MDTYQLIVPTGVVSFVLFAFALINGIARVKLLRYHAATGYVCCAVVLLHSGAAILSNVIEPLGVLATAGMLLTTVSGIFRDKRRFHIVLALITLVFSILHVALILYLR